MQQSARLMPLLASPEGRISRNARQVGGQASIGSQPTRLSALDFEMCFASMVDSERKARCEPSWRLYPDR
jgi:hypothetical protein